VTDFELLTAWRAGDKLAGGRLIDRYHGLLWRTAVTKVPRDDVEDLIHRVVVAILERRDTLRDDTKFRAYLLAVTRYQIAEYYRTRIRRKTDFVSVVDSAVEDLAPGPSTIVFEKTEHRLLLEALRSLPMDDQFVLELHYWEGMTGPELASVFDLLEPTVRGRIRRAKKRLRESLLDLARQHPQLRETVTDLDAWAQSVREDFRRQGP